MRKIWVIARRELYETYTNVSLIVIMIITPVVLATIIGLALGGTDDGSSIQDIPMGIVNLDEGDTGNLIVNIFIPPTGDANLFGELDGGTVCEVVSDDDNDTGAAVSLQDMTEAELVPDVATARTAIQQGDYAAVIVLPPNLTQDLTYTDDNPNMQPVTVTVLADPARTLSADIVAGISESILTQFAVGNVTVASTIDTLVERAQERTGFGLSFLLLSQRGDFAPNFACAFDPDYNPIQLEAQTLGGEAVGFSPFVYFGSANAMFFLLFTAQGGATSILEDRRQWVLQRFLMSPTPRIVILLGKLMGTVLTCVVQLIVLFIAFTLVGSLMSGAWTFIWGDNILMIAALVLAASISASGLGTLLAALASSAEQSSTIGTMINIAMGALGGAFFVVEGVPAWDILQQFSLVFWGSDGFRSLSVGDTAIGLNLAVLLIQGVAMFLLGLWVFNRRLDE